MHKPSKQKNSSQAIKTSRNITIREATSLTSRTPQNQKLQIKKPNMHKFKSIPALSYKDLEMTSMPTEHAGQAYSGNQMDTVLTIQQSEPRLMYSVSDRNHHSGSKVSFHNKMQRSNKSKKTMVNSKNQSQYTLETQRKTTRLENIYQRTKLVLDSYRLKQQKWKKEKSELLLQLEKCKAKNKKRKNSSIVSQPKNVKL